ncbi:hypothetical protein [Flavobacterium silvaticum]|uniref:Outer membrane protein beta-barrel domain-containing protein n=1 Tax=Flavobacterium silvaticum TaxID=1852020 RepID=A0A972FJR6_9FLAO|nr:hypothetical protein [Flavobacterium silvaticum]NMH26957.1 hypothetical protein [Flavobacterium silvaticum]
MKKFFTLACLLGSLLAVSQETAEPVSFVKLHKKGSFFIFYGGNKDKFSKSDIRFWGNGYDFTLDNVDAHDKYKGFSIDYLNPSRITIPQTNYRIGYYLTDKYVISIGLDHMKYVMTQFQTADMTGYITGHAPFNGTYNHSPEQMTMEFLQFEHTDGLNYINLEGERHDPISEYLGLSAEYIQVNTIVGAGGGILLPKTNTTLMGQERHDKFHLSGYGMAAKVGLNLTFFKHFFVQSELKGGYINMPDVRTTFDSSDHASHHFTFRQTNLVFGGVFKV